MENLRKITPDKERAKSLYKLASIRERQLTQYTEEEGSLFIETSYEMIKELFTAKLFVKGYKTEDHLGIIHYCKKNRILSENDCELINQLRKKRNDLVYRGVFIDKNYIKRNKKYILEIIRTMKDKVKKEIEN